MRLYLTTLKPTDSVIDGFLPAARALGCDVTILTDRPEQYGDSAAAGIAEGSTCSPATCTTRAR
nr:hypothetical protein GCM10020093_059440 [Planobispora longispora]